MFGLNKLIPTNSNYSFMDYRKLFDWHPNYNCFFHEVEDHGGDGFIDDENNWVATSIIKKKMGK